MKNYRSKVGMFVAAVLLSTACSNNKVQGVVEINEPQASPQPGAEANSVELGNYVLMQMKIVNAQMTDVRRQVIARQIVSVAMEIFDNQEARKQFVTLIAIESKFDSKAKSHVGATGLTQLMPQYAPEFAKACGIEKLDPSDLDIAEINLLIGACRFRHLLEIFNGQTSLALVAYNAGASSNQIKQLQELRNLSTVETSSYISKWLFLKEKTNIEIDKEESK